jgi:hypothetical protein
MNVIAPVVRAVSLSTLALLPFSIALAVDVTITDATPSLIYDDTTSASPQDWILSANAAANDQSGQFLLQSWINNNFQTVVQITSNSTTDNHSSLLIEGTGDMSFANGAVTIDRVEQKLGIGTLDPIEELHIASPDPIIFLEDEDNANGQIRVNAGLMQIGGSSSSKIQMSLSGPGNALYVDSLNNIGFGTNSPSQAVDVERSAAAARFQLTSFTSSATEAPQYIQRRARGNVFAPTAVLNNDNLGLFSFRGYNGTTMGGSRATITAQAAGNFSNSSTPTRLIFATTPVGQITPQQVLVITPDGKVQVNGQNLTVPDYVFQDDYQLMPLEELRAFIDANGHLPGIAPAHEVNANGLDLAGSQMDQLQKIEELTLYVLQQQGHSKRQDRELDALRRENSELRAQLARLDRIEAQLARLPKATH